MLALHGTVLHASVWRHADTLDQSLGRGQGQSQCLAGPSGTSDVSSPVKASGAAAIAVAGNVELMQQTFGTGEKGGGGQEEGTTGHCILHPLLAYPAVLRCIVAL